MATRNNFGDYFSENMNALGMPVPSGLFSTLQGASFVAIRQMKFRILLSSLVFVFALLFTYDGSKAFASDSVILTFSKV
jgi:hypothetical protein